MLKIQVTVEVLIIIPTVTIKKLQVTVEVITKRAAKIAARFCKIYFFVQVSLSVAVRLKIRFSAVLSGSIVKYPIRINCK